MSRQVLAGFIVLNVIVSLLVAFSVLVVGGYFDSNEPAPAPTQFVILTATPIPGMGLQPGEYQSTIDALQLTGTALFERAEVVAVVTATPDLAEGLAVANVTAVATIDPARLPPVPTDLPPGAAPPEPEVEDDGCVRYVVQSGDFIIQIAQEFGVFPGDILLANNLAEADATRLQIGQVLIIPVPGCTALITPTPSPSPTNTPFSLTQRAATVTLPPTALNAQVVIADVMGWGSVTNEAVEIRNVGNVINLQDWTLTNERGDTYRFPEFRMQQGSLVRVFSRQGQNTPVALYWGREVPAWSDGDTVTLADAAGQMQATFRVGETQPLFQEATRPPGG